MRPRRRRQAGAKVAYGGEVVDYADRPPEGNADLIGLLAAVIILLFAFGSVVAMGLPILTALLGLGVGIAIINIFAAVTEIGTLAPTLATMIGLGVGIDYSLFIVTRYRENRAAGMDTEAATGRSVATAGSAVLFAGTTVVIAICGLAIAGIPYVAKLGYMAAVVVAVMMLAALTLLPAVIGLVGQGHRPLEGTEPHPPSGSGPGRGRRRGRRRRHLPPRQRLGALGHAGGEARVAVCDPRHHHPDRARPPGAVDAAGAVRRRQPPEVGDATTGLRPHRRRLRAGHERATARRGRAAVGRRRRRARRHHVSHLQDRGRAVGAAAAAQPGQDGGRDRRPADHPPPTAPRPQTSSARCATT